ncbi:hypothetical protein [Rhodovulum sp. PH10]|uniref:hypothetical protein n=1 Tax=Rhodovulum sp. PH10 TaxID=1187851 RepID=UPI0003180F60|nr:hypothetical protein [Rhodovulum sp. PH10]
MAYAIIFFVLFVFAVYYWTRWRTKQELMFERHASKFYESIAPLLDDPDTPSGIVELIEFLNDIISDRSIASKILGHLLFRHKGFEETYDDAEDDPAVSDFLGRRKELMKPLMEAIVSSLVAMTYRGPVAGVVLRRLVFFDLARVRSRPAVVASELKSFFPDHHGGAAATAC